MVVLRLDRPTGVELDRRARKSRTGEDIRGEIMLANRRRLA